LAFFEKDPIEWREHPIGELYRKLFALKKRHAALWNGHWGAAMIKVPNDAPSHVLSFVRRSGTDKVFAVINFSGEARSVGFKESLFPGAYTDAFSGEAVELEAATGVQLAPWGFRVFVG